MRAALIHNPTAGSGNVAAEELTETLKKAGFDTHYFSSKDDDYKHCLSIVDDAEIVIVAGGDGTVAKVVLTLSDRRVPIAILPLGTANNIAHSLEVGGEVAKLISRLQTAPTKRLDVGCATGPWGFSNFLESVGWGALAKVVDIGVPDQSQKHKIASGRELFAQVLEIARPRSIRLKVDGKKIEGEFIFIEILNIGVTGPRILISPSASPGDRLLDVVCLRVDEKQRLIDWLRSSPDETRIPLKETKAKTVSFLWSDGPLRIDDEVFDTPQKPGQVQVEIEPQGLRVCVPSEA